MDEDILPRQVVIVTRSKEVSITPQTCFYKQRIEQKVTTDGMVAVLG